MAFNPNDSSSLNSYSSSNSDSDSDDPAAPAPAPAPAAPVDVADPLLPGSAVVRNALSHFDVVAAEQETPPKSPHDALVVMQLRNIRTAQKNSRGAVFAAGPFGSSDGIGGEGAFGPGGSLEEEEVLAVGDGSGRLHILSVCRGSVNNSASAT